MARTKHDEIFLGILKEEAHLIPFLDAMFGFLYRCTDFYQIQSHPKDKLGFPQGVAEDIVNKSFKKWERTAEDYKEFCAKQRASTSADIPPPFIQEVEVITESESSCQSSESKKVETQKKSPTKLKEKECEEKNDQTSFQNSDTSYNGAIRDGYQWSQSITDLDVQVTVPHYSTKARDVKVEVSPTRICILAEKEGSQSEWFTVIDQELCHKTNKEESIWSLVSGKHIQLHLEKAEEKWWEALFTDEPKIDLKKIDASRPMDDLSQEEQMKIQELMWNEERKRLGLPTSDNLALEKIVKESWSKEGSPFEGRPYNQKEINFGANHICIHDCEGNT